jgi:hypothetical protein
MADNIKIIGNIGNIERISRFKSEDINLLPSNNLKQSFGFQNDYIEFFAYDESNSISYTDYNYKNFKLPSDSYVQNYDQTLPLIEIDPVNDLTNLGYTTGTFKTQYNFFKRKISNFTGELFIDEISEDRTEIRINSTIITTEDLIIQARELISDLESSLYEKLYLLNFNSNLQQLAINVAIDNTTPTSTVLFKLYSPLDVSVNVKDTLWVVEEIIEPYVFNIDLDTLITLPPIPKLRRPNFDIKVDVKNNLPTGYENYSSLISSLTGSSYYNVLNYMNDNSYDLNIDYTSFSNFIHFGSAEKRLNIFNYKLGLIHSYNSNINNILLSNSSSILANQETASLKLKIDDMISKFDGFEHYLYFESGSKAWPKTTNLKPYTNKFLTKYFYQPKSSSIWNFTHSLNEIPKVVSIYSGSGQLLTTQSSTVGLNTISLTFNTTSSGYVILSSPSASMWYGEYTSSAASYDEENLDWLYYIIPNYIKNDPDNYQSYYDFVDMIGHYFDNMWIYITSINELYNADNNLEKGISKDIVYDTLKSLGVNLYNSKGGEDFNNYIEGTNSGSVIFNDADPSMFSITSSFLNNIPRKDLLSELYKRIYHNLPLISKTKGTVAGLQNLITTFGITSSIFAPKEFGGSNRYELTKGYDNDKITIQNNTITGSVLSPYISLQQSYTSSEDYTSTDLHFIDLSFSPQTQVNKRISSSIALSNPTFSLDNYIGDPRLSSSSSYDLLDLKRNELISSSAAISGSAKRLDYKGFFELVKYFDNSLFRMLRDFVPVRTNPLTGISIQSPIIERNKIATFPPKVSEGNIQEANYNGPIISEDTSYQYPQSVGNKSSFYTGDITGSVIDVNDYFENSNPNPYLFVTKSINVNEFNHTDFNVMLNNVSSSLKSKSRYKLENLSTSVNSTVFSNNLKYSSSAELQDSYLTLDSYQNSRHKGTKISSLRYNTYTSASSTYSGDVSYGKTAVINRNSNKLGLFTQIKENTFLGLPKKNNATLTYLVDIEGNLTELNNRNKHWVDVQNIFKSGDNAVVSLFDTQKYSNQKTTNGLKPIFSSGYSYTPALYNSNNSKLYFKYIPNANTNLFKVNTNGGFIKSINSGSSITYNSTGNNIYDLFNVPTDILDDEIEYIDGNNENYISSSGDFPKFKVTDEIPQKFSSAFSITLNDITLNNAVEFKFSINNETTGEELATQTLNFTSSYISRRSAGTYANIKNYKYIQVSDSITESFNNVSISDNNSGENLGRITDTYYWVRLFNTIVECSAVLTNSEVLYISKTDLDFIKSTFAIPASCSSTSSNIFSMKYLTNIRFFSRPILANASVLNFNLNTDFKYFATNTLINFKLIKGGNNPASYTAFVNPGGSISNQTSTNQIGNYPYASFPFIVGASGSNAIILSSELSKFKDYQFIPDVVGDKNNLYTTYGDISSPLNPKLGDMVVLYYDNGNNVFESPISKVTTDSSGRLNINLNINLPKSLMISSYSSTAINKFLILSKQEDETNVILVFDKKAGDTSLGFLIPSDIHPDVLNNIDTITKEVKQKLIDLGSINGGSF